MSRGEILFLAAIVACAAAAAVLLAVGVKPGGRPQGKQIGTVTFKNHFAGRKLSGEVVWNAVAQNAPVYNLDSIRTGRDSTATIHLQNAVEIRLGEESLILLDLTPRQTNLRLIGGSVAVQMTAVSAAGGTDTAAPAPVLISAPAGQVALSSGTLSAADSGRQVSLTEGSAVFTNGSGSQQMSGNARVDPAGQVIAGPSVRPVSPADGDAILTGGDSALVEFRWQGEPAGAAAGLMLTVADDRTFSRSEFAGKVSGGEARVALPPGTHYWRLSSARTPDAALIPGWFTVQSVPAPRLIAPLGRTYMAVEGRPASVDFSWTPSDAASAYRLEITGQGSSGPAVAPVTTTSSSVTLETLGKGDYSWTVTALAGPRSRTEARSVSGAFSISTGALPAAHIRETPGAGGAAGAVATFSEEAVHNGAVLASWDPVDGADRYVATVSKDPKGQDTVASVATSSNVLQVNRPLEKGTYYVTVQAVSGESRSPSSRAVQIAVVDSAPLELREPEDGAKLDPTVREIPFRWADPNGGRAYRIQVASDEGFASLIVDQRVAGVRQAVLRLADEVSGDLRWKVSLLDDGGREISRSVAAHLFLPKLLASPRAISPRDGSRLDVNKTERIVFQWEPVAEATEYQVAFYRATAGLRSLVKSWTSTTPQIIFNRFEDLSTGPFSWEVRAVQGQGGVTAAESRSVISYFTIEQSSPLPAPRVTIRRDAAAAAAGKN